MQIVGMDRGFVLEFDGQSIAVGTVDQLVKAVRQAATMFDNAPKTNSGNVPTQAPPSGQRVEQQLVGDRIRTVTFEQDVEDTEAGDLDVQRARLQQMVQWYLAGNVGGKPFTRDMWDAGVREYLPDIDPSEADYILSEAVREQREALEGDE